LGLRHGQVAAFGAWIKYCGSLMIPLHCTMFIPPYWGRTGVVLVHHLDKDNTGSGFGKLHTGRPNMALNMSHKGWHDSNFPPFFNKQPVHGNMQVETTTRISTDATSDIGDEVLPRPCYRM
jgi:hypothetical protein